MMEEKKQGFLAEIAGKWGVFMTPKKATNKNSPLSKTEIETPTSLSHSHPMQNTPSSTISDGLEASGINQHSFRKSRSSSAPLISSSGLKGMERLESGSRTPDPYDNKATMSLGSYTKKGTARLEEDHSDDGYDSADENIKAVQIHLP